MQSWLEMENRKRFANIGKAPERNYPEPFDIIKFILSIIVAPINIFVNRLYFVFYFVFYFIIPALLGLIILSIIF